MKNPDYDILMKNPLFAGIDKEDLSHMLSCLGAYAKKYQKDEFLLLSGDMVSAVGIVLSGKAVVLREDEEGTRSIVSAILPGECFGESFACSDHPESFVTVQATEECQVLFLDCRKIITVCHSACAFHTMLISNMLAVLTDKIRGLNQKLDILSRRKIRDRVLIFLEAQKKDADSNEFRIPFNREQLADYLMVDRSALSAELGRMQEEELIAFHRDRFRLLP